MANITGIENNKQDYVYAREPLSIRNSIPVFSEINEYIENYEKISSDHIESHQKNGTNPFIPEEVWEELESSTIQLVEKYSKPNDMILDVGVGLGRVLDKFPNLKRYGVDISFNYLPVARSKGINVCYSLIEDMPFKENIFDIIICTDVLEHVLDLNLCCKKIISSLKPDGILIIRVPYREDLSPYLSQDYPYRFVHLRNFDENSLYLFFDRILNCSVISNFKSGYITPYPVLQRMYLTEPINRILSLIKKLNPKIYEIFRKKLLRPIEINTVVKKKKV